MSEGANEAIRRYDAELSHTLMAEAREGRKEFIKAAVQFLAFALQKNREEYDKIEEARKCGESSYEFNHYAETSDWDEQRVKQGDEYVRAVLFLKKNVNHGYAKPSIPQTEEMLIAIPTQPDFEVRDDTTIEDVDTTGSVFVYWKTTDGEQGCYEVTAEGVFKAKPGDEEQSFVAMLDSIEEHDFSILHTSAPLVARFREDIVNLDLVPHFTTTLDWSGDDIQDS